MAVSIADAAVEAWSEAIAEESEAAVAAVGTAVAFEIVFDDMRLADAPARFACTAAFAELVELGIVVAVSLVGVVEPAEGSGLAAEPD